jgi:hypothetical protein
MTKTVAALVMLCCAQAIPGATARAEEGGSGHYQPGAAADFSDMLPGREGLVYLNVLFRYSGSTGATQPLEIGGRIDTHVKATSYVDSSLFL